MEGLLNSSSTPPQILPSSPSRPLPPAAMRPAHRSSHRSHLLHFCLVSLPQTPSFPPSVPPLCLHPPRSLDGISQGRILTRLGWSLARLGCGVVGVWWRGRGVVCLGRLESSALFLLSGPLHFHHIQTLLSLSRVCLHFVCLGCSLSFIFPQAISPES